MFRQLCIILLLAAEVHTFTVSPLPRSQRVAVTASSRRNKVLHSESGAADVSEPADSSVVEGSDSPADAEGESGDSADEPTSKASSPFRGEKFTAFVGNLPYCKLIILDDRSL